MSIFLCRSFVGNTVFLVTGKISLVFKKIFLTLSTLATRQTCTLLSMCIRYWSSKNLWMVNIRHRHLVLLI